MCVCVLCMLVAFDFCLSYRNLKLVIGCKLLLDLDVGYKGYYGCFVDDGIDFAHVTFDVQLAVTYQMAPI